MARAGAVERAEIGPDDPLRLVDALEIAFPCGGMTVSGLRRERDRGRLAIEKIAGREFTTLRAIEEMRRLCLDPRRGRVSTSSSQTAAQATGSSETGSISRERAAPEGDIEGAERSLENYLRKKRRPGGSSRPDKVSIASVIALYSLNMTDKVRRPDVLLYTAATLERWWGDKVVSDVKGATCRAYVKWRQGQVWAKAKTSERTVGLGTVRRELETLRAAINHYHAEHTLDAVPVVTLPEKPQARDRWLTRSEAARLLWATRRHPDSRHLARFILIGLYTGTRHSAILNLGWIPNVMGGWVDVDKGVIHRRAAGASETKKRTPPAALPDRILPHLRRWRRLDDKRITHVVHFEGMPIKKERRAWRSACAFAKLGPEVVPHIMRHTSITWAMQNGADPWEAAGFYGVTVEVLQSVYGHHHPDFQKEMRKVF